MHFRLLYACLFATHLICRVILQLLLYRSVHVIITCSLRSVIFFVCSVSLKFARVGTIVKLVFMKLSKKHVGPDAAVESTTGSGERSETLGTSRSWLHRSSTGNGVEELSDKKKREKNIHYVLGSNCQVVLEDLSMPSEKTDSSLPVTFSFPSFSCRSKCFFFTIKYFIKCRFR